jgi:hypothetical protein
MERCQIVGNTDRWHNYVLRLWRLGVMAENKGIIEMGRLLDADAGKTKDGASLRGKNKYMHGQR